MIVYFPMYSRPETQEAYRALWGCIHQELGRGPDAINTGLDDWNAWRSDALLLSQTCGLPYRARLYGDVELVGVPDYGLDGCPAGTSCSVIIAKASAAGKSIADFSGAIFAYHDSLSQGSWAAPMMRMRGAGILPGELLETANVEASAVAVAEGAADFAGIDALTWEMIKTYDPAISDALQVIERTEPTPAPPFITALGENPAEVLAAMQAALLELDDVHRTTLHLKGILPVTPSEYLAVPTPPGPALLMHQLKK